MGNVMNFFSAQEEKPPVYVWCPPEKQGELNKLLGDMDVQILPYDVTDPDLNGKNVVPKEENETKTNVQVVTPCDSGDMQPEESAKKRKQATGSDDSNYYENFYNNYGIDWHRRGCK